MSLSSEQVRQKTGITNRQLRYWAQTGKIPGPLDGWEGSGTHARWDDAVVSIIQKRIEGLRTCPDCGERYQ